MTRVEILRYFRGASGGLHADVLVDDGGGGGTSFSHC